MTEQSADYERLRNAIRTVVAEKEADYDNLGDAWLFHPNPDEAYLRIDALTDAIVDTVRAHIDCSGAGES